MIIRYFTVLLFAVTFSAFAAQPFQWNWRAENGTLTVTLQTEAGSYAYRNKTSVLLNSKAPETVPVPIAHEDSIMGKRKFTRGKIHGAFPVQPHPTAP